MNSGRECDRPPIRRWLSPAHPHEALASLFFSLLLFLSTCTVRYQVPSHSTHAHSLLSLSPSYSPLPPFPLPLWLGVGMGSAPVNLLIFPILQGGGTVRELRDIRGPSPASQAWALGPRPAPSSTSNGRGTLPRLVAVSPLGAPAPRGQAPSRHCSLRSRAQCEPHPGPGWGDGTGLSFLAKGDPPSRRGHALPLVRCAVVLIQGLGSAVHFGPQVVRLAPIGDPASHPLSPFLGTGLGLGGGARHTPQTPRRLILGSSSGWGQGEGGEVAKLPLFLLLCWGSPLSSNRIPCAIVVLGTQGTCPFWAFFASI
ncbi:hypothetical protein GQ53DRAFT_259471 [Thozetella sp. PMI_491]|nr:hypothetical protein GQ53DRAFT_259471 [Thozetella sp. PMI_491]